MSEFTIGVADSLRKFDSNSPKSSPRGNRSPVVPRQDSSGTLKTTISLGKNPSIVYTGPFYLLKELPGDSEITGSTNLMSHYSIEHSYTKFCSKKVKDSLSSFLPNLPGIIDVPGHTDNSSLRSVIEKPPIGGKELAFLNNYQLSGFRLHPGALSETYRSACQAPSRKKHKDKKQRHKAEASMGDIAGGSSLASGSGTPTTEGISGSLGDSYEKKHKKQKRHEEEKDRKKKKKDKKKKKQRHSPEHPGSGSMSAPTSVGTPTLPLL
uniref:Mediator of RNA polymerase II transcription subunit 19 n=1 Tax=Lynceus sp. MCZ IZ 141354 TaxID=1930659 RepID=A0A9N6WW59_9CRUS|nr:EOG090X0DK3 [Lynceus sp. MCZ IZ 141354]